MSTSHPEQWVVRELAERPDRLLVTALREFATTQIADCGGPVTVVAPPLRHLAGGAQLCDGTSRNHDLVMTSQVPMASTMPPVYAMPAT